MKLKPTVRIKAESILIHPSAYGQVMTFTMFKPTADTIEALKAAERGDMFKGIEVTDMNDDGAEESYENKRIFTFLKLDVPDARKQHTQVVSFTMS